MEVENKGKTEGVAKPAEKAKKPFTLKDYRQTKILARVLFGVSVAAMAGLLANSHLMEIHLIFIGALGGVMGVIFSADMETDSDLELKEFERGKG